MLSRFSLRRATLAVSLLAGFSGAEAGTPTEAAAVSPAAGDVVAPPAAAVPPPAAAARLVQALRERRVVLFRYHGRERVVEPHVCGLATSGEPVLHGFQIGGGSVSGGALPGWRTFALAEIEGLSLSDTRFPAPRPDYAADRPRLDPVWGEVAKGE